MSVSMYQSNVNRLQGQVAGIRKKISDDIGKKSKLLTDISRIQGSISKNTSLSLLRSKQRQINSKLKELEKIEGRIASNEKKLSSKNGELSRNQKNLDNALEREAKKKREQERKLERERKREQDQALKRTKALNAELDKQRSITGSPLITGGPVSIYGEPVIHIGGEPVSHLPKKPKSDKTHSKPWDDTLQKLDDLRAIREESKRKGQIIGWTVACQQVGIEPRTARKHDPELRQRWKDKDF